MENQEKKIEVNTAFEFTVRNKGTLIGLFVKEYHYKDKIYLQLKTHDCKRYLINPKKAKQI